MLEREVTKIVKDDSGKIIELRNQYMGWSPITTLEVIKHIEGNLYNYYANLPNVGKVYLQVMYNGDQKILTTDPQKTSRNILDDLPVYVTYDN